MRWRCDGFGETRCREGLSKRELPGRSSNELGRSSELANIEQAGNGESITQGRWEPCYLGRDT